MNKPKNENYAAVVVQIKTLVPLTGCDFVQAAIIMGNQIIVSKEVKIGDIGLFFPVETALSNEYLKANNLYRKPELNNDPTQKGYFEENRRIRCVKFRGHKSEGLFMPLSSVLFITYKDGKVDPILTLGETFDELNGVPICEKYVVKTNRIPGQPGSKKDRTTKYESKLVENQFRFHEDTAQLYRNIHRINPEDLISITYKLHGCVSEDTIINTDQGNFTIKFIVDNKLKVNIKAFDTETNQIIYVPIDEYYLLKNDGEWYEIELEDGTILKITGNNPVWLPELNCYRKAELLNVSDVLLIAE